MAEIELGNLYDINKELMKNEKPLDPILFNTEIRMIARKMYDSCEHNNQHYWMLLCHDRRDFTLFNIIASEYIADIEEELKPTLLNRGQVISIDRQNNEVWEIWIRDVISAENFAYYLFKYDNGVIEINS